jgi:histone H3/H4
MSISTYTVKVSKPAIRRLATEAGVRSISGSVYDDTQKILNKYLSNMIASSVNSAKNDRRQRVKSSDVVRQFGGAVRQFGGAVRQFGGALDRSTQLSEINQDYQDYQDGEDDRDDEMVLDTDLMDDSLVSDVRPFDPNQSTEYDIYNQNDDQFNENNDIMTYLLGD